MSNAYNIGAYPVGDAGIYQPYVQPQKPNVIGSVLGASAVGFVAGTGVGATIDYLKNKKPVKNGTVSENFAKRAFDKYINNGLSEDGKNFFKQVKELWTKLDKVKTPDEFKSLLKNNELLAKKLYNGVSIDTVFDTLNKDNLSSKIKTLKNSLESTYNNQIQNIKDSIIKCWDSKAKKFVKPDDFKNIKLFNAIKSAKSSVNWKKVIKEGGITAAVAGCLVLGMNLLVSAGNPKPEQIQYPQ